MQTSSKLVVIILAAALGSLAMGGMAAAFGFGPFDRDVRLPAPIRTDEPDRSEDRSRDEDGESDLREPGSIPVADEDLPEDDRAERVALAALATVDQARAEARAIVELGEGTVVDSELDDEDGFVVWEVAVRSDDGTWREITVDAGDGRVLKVDDDLD